MQLVVTGGLRVGGTMPFCVWSAPRFFFRQATTRPPAFGLPATTGVSCDARSSVAVPSVAVTALVTVAMPRSLPEVSVVNATPPSSVTAVGLTVAPSAPATEKLSSTPPTPRLPVSTTLKKTGVERSRFEN